MLISNIEDLTLAVDPVEDQRVIQGRVLFNQHLNSFLRGHASKNSANIVQFSTAEAEHLSHVLVLYSN